VARTSLEVGDGLVARDEGGDGPGVLWLHPYTMDSTVFGEIWSRFPGWRHVALDLPGHGASRPLAPGDRLDGVGRVIADFAEREGLRHLIGVSFGTIVALQAAIERPDVFAGLVLAAPGLASGPGDADVGRRYVELETLFRERGRGPHMTALWMRSPPDIFRYVADRPELARHLGVVIDRHTWAEFRTYAMRGLLAPAQDRSALERVRARTLIVLGEHDLPAQLASAHLIAGSVPDVRVARVERAGHLAVLEDPVAAARLIGAHLAAVSTGNVARSFTR
jgi:2-succinyl-6-hydroxy-2,4-cyclohexadiene-1-carboxylate synthase